MNRLRRFLSFVLLLFPLALPAADFERCFVCGGLLSGTIYVSLDEVTQKKVGICTACEEGYPACFLCGLPAKTNAPGFVGMNDGRAMCGRDAQTAVLNEADGIRICLETQDRLDRLFSRFLAFPETNVVVAVVDRVHLQDLFKFAGRDYRCPNVWGFERTETNRNHLEHRISILSGLPLSWFQATCAHEYTHAWINQNVSGTRRRELSIDAVEGFCELISYLLMESLQDEERKAGILRNNYTRGQIHLFLDAYRRYGFNDVLDWMKAGAETVLNANDPDRIRRVATPARPTPAPRLVYTPPPAPPAPDTLLLKAVFWDPRRPTAMINNRTFAVDDEAEVRVGASNVLVRCLAIRQDSARIRLVTTGAEQDLTLKSR